MTFRTTVRDGMININTRGEIPDGEVVEIVRIGPASSKSTAKTVKRSRATKRPKKDPFLAAFGAWKDRPEWKGKTALEIQQILRQKALGGASRGKTRR